MVVTAIAGVLGAVAVPKFLEPEKYLKPKQQLQKSSEPDANVKTGSQQVELQVAWMHQRSRSAARTESPKHVKTVRPMH